MSDGRKCRRTMKEQAENKFFRVLQNALQQREFEMYLQPKVNPKTGRIGGAEALVRWNSPIYGRLQPDSFIPFLEYSGMILEIDLYMFRRVCELLHHWKVSGVEPVVISVNVSKYDMEYPKLLEEYDRILEETEAPAEYLELEITENMAYHDVERMHRLLDWTHKRGARCAMDDFGKAYSNLNAIQELEFDTVKLDKCFFRNDFPRQERGKKIVWGLLELFRSLDIEVVAEGVETEEQKLALEQMDCELIQGYYYSKPLPVAVFEAYCRQADTLI